MKYRLAEHVTLTEVDNEVVLLDLEAGQYFGINHVGACFLKQLENNKNKQQAIQHVANHYKKDLQQVENDLSELLDSLLTQRLLITIE